MALQKCIHLRGIRSHLLARELVVRPAFSCLTYGCMWIPSLPSSSSALHTNAVERLHGTGSLNWQSRWPSLTQQVNFYSTNVAQGLPEKVVLYRAKWMRPLRLMVRLKIIQLGGLAALALPLAEYANEGSLSVGTVAAVTAVVGGAGAASAALWYYSRRYVGEMALAGTDLRVVQLSVIDFWGNREDNKYELSYIVPPLKGLTKSELENVAKQMLVPLNVIGERQYFLSLRHGFLFHKEVLFSLLCGTVDNTSLQSLLGRQAASPPDPPLQAAGQDNSLKEDSAVRV